MFRRLQSSVSVLQKDCKVSAVAKARSMFVEVCGPRDWSDTRESWLARGARRVGMSVRRARSLFYQQPLKLSADEYFSIEERYLARFRALDERLAEDLRRLEAPSRPSSVGEVREAGASSEGRGREHPEGPRPSLCLDGR